MFDVIWTDPDRELVGEHRAKKEIAREQKRAKEKAEPSRPSLSTRASSSSSDKPFSFFGSRSLRKGAQSLRSRPPSHSSTLLSPTTPVDNTSRRHTPNWNAEELLQSPGQTTGSVQLNVQELAAPDSLPQRRDASRPPSSRDSVASRWTEGTSLADVSTAATSTAGSVRSSVTQALGPSSFVTVSTAVTVSPRTPETDIRHRLSEISISSDGARTDISSLPLSPREQNFIPSSLDSPVNLVPSPKSPLRPLSPSWASSFKPNNLAAWKPPDAWNSPPSEAATNKGKTQTGTREDDTGSRASVASLDLQGMEREVEMMAAASPVIILQRLREVWADAKDARLYQELEMQKKRWMLSALRTMDATVDRDTSRPSPSRIPAAKVERILALHETHASSSYLAAVHCTKQVYHMSSAPLSHRHFPNIHPLLAPVVSASNFPLASELFGAVYSLSLPNLVPSPEIPQMLRSIHRCLVTGGTFHLTLIDPMPVASSLGPRMRSWLEAHLLLSLERSFRCVNPSKLFPIWLADSALRGEGSTITTAKFLAVPQEAGEEPRGVAGPPRLDDDKDIKTELRGVVGRMLWMEVWGGFVTAERWWWEDPACVDECLELGTYWEYNLIEAVKDASN